MRGPHTDRARRTGVTLSGCCPRPVGASIADMPSFHAGDGTELGYHVRGEGAPLVFPAVTFVVQPGAGHDPWLDDARWFVSTVTEFLDSTCP